MLRQKNLHWLIRPGEASHVRIKSMNRGLAGKENYLWYPCMGFTSGRLMCKKRLAVIQAEVVCEYDRCCFCKMIGMVLPLQATMESLTPDFHRH